MRFWTSNPRSENEPLPPRPAVQALDAAPLPAGTADALREAYARGRRDERARHRRSPLMVLSFSLAALVGAAILATSAFRGSFEGGGALIDRGIVATAEEARPALKAAAQDAGRMLRGEPKAAVVAPGGEG